MASFKIAYSKTGLHEGGYANIGADKGGETYMGISRRWHPKWEGWAIVDTYKLKNKLKNRDVIPDNTLTELVETFYYKMYWTRILGDQIKSQRICDMLFDWMVTSDDDAIKYLQMILKVKVDGDLGAKTIAALNAANEDEVFNSYKLSRKEFYHAIVKKDDTQKVFLKGWLNRVDSFC